MAPKAAISAKTTAAGPPPSSKGAPVAPRATMRGKKITKADAAKILGVSTSMVRVLVRQEELRGEVASDGVRYFDRAEVLALAARRAEDPKNGRRRSSKGSPATSPATSAGELAAHGFELLSRGVSPVEIVMQMKTTPEWVEDLVARFNSLRSLEVARAEAGPKCATCRENVARFCGSCVAPLRKAGPTPAAAPSG